MRGGLRLLALGSLLLLKITHSQADDLALTRIGQGNAQTGKLKAEDNRCTECHGLDGISSDLRIPNHAGQIAAYLIKQLRDFKSGARLSQVMNIMAEDLNDSDMADIAAYFASQKAMQGEGGHELHQAENLFLNGDAGRNIPACGSCHGVNGKGALKNSIPYPVIGGQHSVYLRTQLMNWRLVSRRNSPDGVMNRIAKALSEDEIDMLSNYISGL